MGVRPCGPALRLRISIIALAVSAGLPVPLPALAHTPLDGRTLVLDPGHSDPCPGAISPRGIVEAQSALDLARRVEHRLQGLGARVILTRPNHAPVDTSCRWNERRELVSRAAIANRAGADIFVGLHHDWYGRDRSVSGITGYHYPGSQNGRLLAAAVTAEIARATGRPDRGTRARDFSVLRNTTMPAALIEIGYLSRAGTAPAADPAGD